MANKRVSELVQITVPEMTIADLLLFSDLTANESKKLTLGDLSTFLVLNGILTGSFFGTASYALVAATASYVNIESASYALTSSWAANSITASHALVVETASFAISSSYVISASYALVSSIQSALSASFANFTKTASYLYLNPNDPNAVNGTASFALTASYIALTFTSISYADSSSWSTNSVTSSYVVSSSVALTASVVNTSSYLAFNGFPNGTASYAIFAGNVVNVRQDYGTFIATTQSLSASQLDLVNITPTFGGLQSTNFDVYGTLFVPFTSSANGRIEMFSLDRQYGFSQSLDFSPISVNIGGASSITGTLRYPFSLHGEAALNGLYEIYITASNGVFLDSARPMRYKIVSLSDQLTVATAEPTIFNSYPVNAIMLWSSSLHPANAYYGSASQVTFSGSYDVTDLVVPANSVNILNYTWTLTGLVTMSVDNNPGLTYLGGIPTSCVSMSAANCGLTQIPDMSSGSIGYLNVPNNTIFATLALPLSMSYLNIANNPFTVLPNTIPYGMTVLIADGNNLNATPFSIPNTLQTMSFASCPNLTSWLAPTLPTALGYWSSNNSPLAINFPSFMPVPMLYFDATNNQLPPVTIGNIAAGLVSNGLNNGFLSILNNPGSSSAFSIDANVTTLRTRGWTVVA